MRSAGSAAFHGGAAPVGSRSDSVAGRPAAVEGGATGNRHDLPRNGFQMKNFHFERDDFHHHRRRIWRETDKLWNFRFKVAFEVGCQTTRTKPASVATGSDRESVFPAIFCIFHPALSASLNTLIPIPDMDARAMCSWRQPLSESPAQGSSGQKISLQEPPEKARALSKPSRFANDSSSAATVCSFSNSAAFSLPSNFAVGVSILNLFSRTFVTMPWRKYPSIKVFIQNYACILAKNIVTIHKL